MTPHQAAVAKSFLAERETQRRHLVIYLSGAHAYGFPSPDSDLDLKCIHIAPTRMLVGLEQLTETAEKIEIVEGEELDYGSNELSPVLRGVIKGNGNFLERILGDLVLGGDQQLLGELRVLAKPIISRRVARHYAGFATSQLKAFDEKPTAKRALYVLRTSATGRHLLAHGEMITDVARLTEFIPPEISELMAIKRQAEKQTLEPEMVPAWRAKLVAAIAEIDKTASTSMLPIEPAEPAIMALDEWLRGVRQTSW
ncbi:MAG TPA: nucleotidyltransferase domain-containing protein [Kofleriaceae bacterium]